MVDQDGRWGPDDRPGPSGRRGFLAACATAGLVGFAGCESLDPDATPATGGTGEAPSTDESSGTTAATSETATAGNPCVAPLSGPDADGDRSEAGSVAWERSITSTPPADEYLWGPVRWVREADDARLLAVTHGGRVIALSRESGDDLWESGFEGSVGTPVVAGGTVVFIVDMWETDSEDDIPDRETRVHALDLERGDERWTALRRSSGLGPGLGMVGANDERAFVHTADDVVGVRNETLHALSLSDGSVEWTATVADVETSRVTGEVLYYGSDGGVTAFGTGGRRAWRWPPGDARSEIRSLAVTCGHAVALSGSHDLDQRSVHGLDIDAGGSRWTADGSGARDLLAAGGRLFVAGDRVGRLDPTTGDSVWMREDSLGDGTNAIVAYDVLFADGESSDGGGIVATFAIRDGTRRWRREFDRDASLLGVTNGRAIAAVDAGADGTRAVALDANTGETRWTVESDRGFGPTLVGSDRAYLVEQERDGGQAALSAVVV